MHCPGLRARCRVLPPHLNPKPYPSIHEPSTLNPEPHTLNRINAAFFDAPHSSVFAICPLLLLLSQASCPKGAICYLQGKTCYLSPEMALTITPTIAPCGLNLSGWLWASALTCRLISLVGVKWSCLRRINKQAILPPQNKLLLSCHHRHAPPSGAR